MLSLSQELANGRPHNGKDLESQNVGNDKDKAGKDEEDLDVELDEPAARLPREAAPRIQEADDAGAAEHSRHDLAAKRAVKGHDEVLVFGENGRLDADQGDDGGEAQEQRAEDADDEDGDDAHDQRCPLRAVVLADVLVLELVQPHEHADGADNVQADIGHGGLDGSGNGKSLPVLLRGDALAEGLVVWHADDLVGPRGVDVGERGAGQGSDDNGRRTKAGDDGGEDLGDEREEEGIQEVDLEASETGIAAGVGDDVLDGAANGRGDGLLVDESDGWSGLEQVLLLLLVTGFMGRRGDGDGCDGGLDHAEGGDDFLERVRYLETCLVRIATLERGYRDQGTYQAHEHGAHEEAHVEQHDTPRRDLDLLAVTGLDRHSALDILHGAWERSAGEVGENGHVGVQDDKNR